MKLSTDLPKKWYDLVKNDLDENAIAQLESFIKKEYQTKTIYPPKELIFNAFQYFNPEQTKVVILGQDPYHGEGEAHGWAFSVPSHVKIPPSLRNIFTELHTDLEIIPPHHGNLENWVKQGVILLNTVLTVEKDKAGSHQNRGWEMITDTVIQNLAENYPHLVFILWGKAAQKKASLITTNHCILQSPHPSPLSSYRGFFGSKPFSQTNDYLKENGKEPIDWKL